MFYIFTVLLFYWQCCLLILYIVFCCLHCDCLGLAAIKWFLTAFETLNLLTYLLTYMMMMMWSVSVRLRESRGHVWTRRRRDTASLVKVTALRLSSPTSSMTTLGRTAAALPTPTTDNRQLTRTSPSLSSVRWTLGILTHTNLP